MKLANLISLCLVTVTISIFLNAGLVGVKLVGKAFVSNDCMSIVLLYRHLRLESFTPSQNSLTVPGQ